MRRMSAASFAATPILVAWTKQTSSGTGAEWLGRENEKPDISNSPRVDGVRG